MFPAGNQTPAYSHLLCGWTLSAVEERSSHGAHQQAHLSLSSCNTGEGIIFRVWSPVFGCADKWNQFLYARAHKCEIVFYISESLFAVRPLRFLYIRIYINDLSNTWDNRHRTSSANGTFSNEIKGAVASNRFRKTDINKEPCDRKQRSRQFSVGGNSQAYFVAFLSLQLYSPVQTLVMSLVAM